MQGLGQLDAAALAVREALEVQHQRAGQAVQAERFAGAPGHRAVVQLVLCMTAAAALVGAEVQGLGCARRTAGSPHAVKLVLRTSGLRTVMG